MDVAALTALLRILECTATRRTAPFWRSDGAWRAGANVAALTALLRILENGKNNLPALFLIFVVSEKRLKKTLSKKLPNKKSVRPAVRFSKLEISSRKV